MLLSHIPTTGGKSYSKFGLIPPIDLGGNRVTEGQMDGRVYNILIAKVWG